MGPDDLATRVTELEQHVGALEGALKAMGWSPPASFAASPDQRPTPPTSQPTPPPPPPPPLYLPPPPRFEPPPYQPLPQYQASSKAAPGFDFADWLSRIGPARILAIVGGSALLLGMAYFLSLAFSRGWIGPELRVALGLLVGFGLLPAGALLFDRARPTLGHVVVAVGLGTIELALFASACTASRRPSSHSWALSWAPSPPGL